MLEIVPIRNVWSLEPGECTVAEEIMKRLNYEVYFPMRDTGVDLLIVSADKHVGRNWHQIERTNYAEVHSINTFPDTFPGGRKHIQDYSSLSLRKLKAP